MNFKIDEKNRSFTAEAFLIVMAFWIGSYAYYQMFLIYELKPLYSYLLIVFFTFLWVLYQRVINPARLGPMDDRLKNICLWICLYISWTSITYLYSSQSSIATEALIIALETSALLACFVMLVNNSVRVVELSAVFAILALAGSVMCLWDFFEPTYSTVPGRGAGLYRNPTIAGEVISLAMTAGFMLIPKKVRWIYLAFCGLGVLATFSRASWLSWGVAVIGLAIMGYIAGERKLSRLLMLLFIIMLIALLMFALFFGATESLINELGLQQYMTINTLNRLGIGDEASLGDFSANERRKVLMFSLDMIRNAPYFGNGLGYTKEWPMRVGPHNMYLLQWVEGGLIQIILYISLLLILWIMASSLGKIMLMQFVLNSLFTHNNLEHPAMLLLFAFIIGTRLINPAQSNRLQGDMHTANKLEATVLYRDK